MPHTRRLALIVAGVVALSTSPALAADLASPSIPFQYGNDEYPFGSDPESVRAADLNQDGVNELLLTTGSFIDYVPESDEKLAVLAPDLRGRLRPLQILDAGSPDTSDSLALESADLTADGRPDAIVAARSGLYLYPAASGATPGLQTPVQISGDGVPGAFRVTDIRAANLNGDARPDLALATNVGIVGILNLDTGFEGEFLDPDTTFRGDLAVGDLNGDGLDDVAAISSHEVVILRSTSGTTYDRESISYEADTFERHLEGVEIADLTADGRSDLAVASSTTDHPTGGGQIVDGRIDVRAQDASGALVANPVLVPMAYPGYTVALGDFNGDGASDVATEGGYRLGAPGSSLLFGARQSWSLSSDRATNSDKLTVGDVSGDGLPDAVFADHNFGLIVKRQIATAPNTIITRPPPALSSDTQVIVDFISDTPDARFECRFRAGQDWEACSPPVIATGADRATSTLEIRAISSTGAIEFEPARATWTTPTTTMATPEQLRQRYPEPTGPDRTLTWDDERDYQFECYLDDVPVGDCASPWKVEGLSPGAHFARLVNVLGSERESTFLKLTVTDDPRPARANNLSIQEVAPELAPSGTKKPLAFGSSLAVDGDTLAVGAPGTDEGRGAIYLFRQTGDDWAQVGELTVQDGRPGDRLGSAVAIDGDVVVGGAEATDVAGQTDRGSLYTFTREGEPRRHETARLTASDGLVNDQLGNTVDIEGDVIVAGSAHNQIGLQSHRGAVYTFAAAGAAERTETARLLASDGETGDQLGISVGISGGVIVAGAPGEGAAYTFASTGAHGRTETGKLTPRHPQGWEESFGASVKIDGATILIGAPGRDADNPYGDEVIPPGSRDERSHGAAFAFTAGGPALRHETTTFHALNGGAFDDFGTPLALHDDLIAAGAPSAGGHGFSYLFSRSGPPRQLESARLDSSKWHQYDHTPSSLAVGDGGLVFVGTKQHAVADSVGVISIYKAAVDGDRDGDQVPDSHDACPDVAASTPDGCPPVVLDRDGDGVLDPLDSCPDVPANTANGCPVVAPDSDGDGVLDPDDDCPSVAAHTTDGCPPPVPDTDGDGVQDPDDSCPTVAANTPDGCPAAPPVTDQDGDGVVDPDDSCPSVPASTPDGCPVEEPQQPADSDGDGVANSADRCPDFAGADNGCVAATANVTVARVGQKLKGALEGPSPCSVGRELNVTSGGKPVATIRSGPDRRFKTAKLKKGKYRVSVDRLEIPSVGSCSAAQSENVRIR